VSRDWIDISVPLFNGMAQWPGDARFARSSTLAIHAGEACNLSQFSASAHVGTHMDAPLHFIDGAPGMDTMPLSATVGAARVIAIHDPDLIRVEELESHDLQAGERVLFKTANSRLAWSSNTFQEKFVHIPLPTAKYLAARRVRTLGVDYLSIGGYDTDGAETHRAILGASIWVIEGLNLQDVEPGNYELVCLPLKMVGADGAPARAILRRTF
jgi:arylformamidase